MDLSRRDSLFSYGSLLYLPRSEWEGIVLSRRIPGLEAVDEAIGRATEMGRSIMYILAWEVSATLQLSRV